jgi:hypothetical protein
MRTAVAALLLSSTLWPLDAVAQGCGSSNPNCIVPTAPPATSNNVAASTAFVHNAVTSSLAVVSTTLPNPPGCPVTGAWTISLPSCVPGCPMVADFVTDNTLCLQNVINMVEGLHYSGTVLIPAAPGFYCVKGGVTLHNPGVQLLSNGGGDTGTTLAACGVDVTLVTMNATYQTLSYLYLLGKGANGDPGENNTFPVKPVISQGNLCAGCILYFVQTQGGYEGVLANGNSWVMNHYGGSGIYGDAILKVQNSGWIYNSFLDHNGSNSVPPSAGSLTSVATRNSYEGMVVATNTVATYGGYYIQAVSPGTASASATITLQNYYNPIIDGAPGNTAVTNASTATNSKVVHFASAPASCVANAGVVDTSSPSSIPFGTTVTLASGGDITMSNFPTATINSGANIYCGLVWGLYSQVGSTALLLQNSSEFYATDLDMTSVTDYSLLANNWQGFNCNKCSPSGGITGGVALYGNSADFRFTGSIFGGGAIKTTPAIQLQTTYAGSFTLYGGVLSGDYGILMQGGNSANVSGVNITAIGSSPIYIGGSFTRANIQGNTLTTGAGGVYCGEIAGTADFNNFVNNICNKTTINNTSSGTHNIVKGNNGVAPLAAAVTPGASGSTYTAGSRPETVYVNGGTTVTVSQLSVQICAASPCTVSLEPNESIVYTYASAPTIEAVRH